MRTAIDLDLFGERLRVLSDVTESADALRRAFSRHLAADPSPVAFVMKAPRNENEFHLLLDRSGLVLARSRTPELLLDVLSSHLGAFTAPPTGTIRIHARAIIRDAARGSEALLVGFPLLSVPPIVERELERRNCRVLDRLAVDVRDDGTLDLAQEPWAPLATTALPGHCGAATATGALITEVLMPGSAPSRTPMVQRVATVAPTIATSRAAAVDIATRMAAAIRYIPMDGDWAIRKILAKS